MEDLARSPRMKMSGHASPGKADKNQTNQMVNPGVISSGGQGILKLQAIGMTE